MKVPETTDSCLSKEELTVLTERIRAAGILSIDTETTSTDPLHAKLAGISFSFEEAEAYYLPLAHLYLGAPDQVKWSEALPILKGMLEDERVLKGGPEHKV